jgi:outer membrane protein TolC
MSFPTFRNRLSTFCSTSLVLTVAVAGCVKEGGLPATSAVAPAQTSETATQKDLPDFSEDPALEDYLRYAALNNAGLESAFNSWKAELERIPQVSSLSDPKFTYKHFIEEVETRVGPQRQSVGISQTFPWFGKLKLRGEIAVESANIARQRYEAEKRRLFLRVKTAYYEYYYLGRAIGIVKAHLELVRGLEEAVRTRYKTAAASYPDMIRLQIELGKLEDRLSALSDMRKPRAASLNALLDRPVDSDLPMPDVLQEEKFEMPYEEAQALLRDNNPDLALLQYTVEKAAKAVDLARKSYYPDIMLGVDYIVTEEARMADVADSGKDPIVAMLTINLPIWRDKYRAEADEAERRYASAQEALAEMENKLAADLQLQLYSYRDAERKIDLYRNILLPKAMQSLTAAQQAFAAGEADFLDLIDALRTVLEFRLLYERSLTDRATGLANIEMLVGELGSPLGDPAQNRNDLSVGQ